MEEEQGPLFTTSATGHRSALVNPKLIEMNDPDTIWRCPCYGLACQFMGYPTIQQLIQHMRESHCLDLVSW